MQVGWTPAAATLSAYPAIDGALPPGPVGCRSARCRVILDRRATGSGAVPVGRPTFYILDAFSLIFQVFHAIPEMTGPAGQPTQAVFGIFRDLLNLVKSRKPDYLAAAFDGEGPVFRSAIYADYKANRSEMPVDLVPQIPMIRRVFEGFRVPVLIEPEMEADDVIATLARRGDERGLDVFIVTSDKDARQLIGDHVRLLNLRNKKEMDADALEKDWGIRPD